jgi:hypothetical protein
MTLVSSGQDDIKVFFIVNGVGKYEGDHDNLAELFSQATASNSIKILLSSRPIPSCVYCFYLLSRTLSCRTNYDV